MIWNNNAMNRVFGRIGEMQSCVISRHFPKILLCIVRNSLRLSCILFKKAGIISKDTESDVRTNNEQRCRKPEGGCRDLI
jgi:hypothetical protein